MPIICICGDDVVGHMLQLVTIHTELKDVHIGHLIIVTEAAVSVYIQEQNIVHIHTLAITEVIITLILIAGLEQQVQVIEVVHSHEALASLQDIALVSQQVLDQVLHLLVHIQVDVVGN